MSSSAIGPWEGPVKDLRRALKAGSDVSARVSDIVRHAELDETVLALVPHPRRRWGRRPWSSVVRQPLTLGYGARFLHRVAVLGGDGSRHQLIEKAVEADSNEARFWRGSRGRGLVASGAAFECVEPLAVREVGSLTVLYFPYIAAVDRPRKASKGDLRRDPLRTVRAIAEFNARNREVGPSRVPRGFNRGARKEPSVEQLSTLLGASLPEAHDLQARWREIGERWSALHEQYRALPSSLCHNDLTPGNVFQRDDKLVMLDFGWAAPGPIGSDLHTVIRWSPGALHDEDSAEHLIRVYADEFAALDHPVELAQVRKGAWITFAMRFLNLRKWASARHPVAFELALRKATAALDDLSSPS